MVSKSLEFSQPRRSRRHSARRRFRSSSLFNWFALFPYYYAGVLQDGYYPTGQGVGVPMYVYAFFLGAFGAVTLALIFAGAPERLKFGG